MLRAKTWWTISTFLVAALALAQLAVAQSSIRGRVYGTVTDQTGAVVPEATVTLTNLVTGVTTTVTTTTTGVYNFPFVDPGDYKIAANKEGFQTAVIEQVKVQTQSGVSVDIKLAVGSSTQEMTVVATAGQILDTTLIGVSGVIETQQLAELPNSGQQYAQLVRLQPGVVAGNLNTGSTSGSSFGASGYISGRRIGDNVVYIDGGMFYDPWAPSQTVIGLLGGPGVSQGTIAEFRVIGNNPSPDTGFTNGGRIEISTKSGTNFLHGSAYEYFRNDKLDARNFFDKNKLPLRRNQFGFTLGGPLRKDKTFFFGSYEGMRQRKLIPQVPIVPTPKLIAAIPAGPTNNFLREIVDLQFPHAVPGTFSPNDLVAPFTTSSNAAIDYDVFFIRVDHTINDNNRITVRHAFNDARASPGAVTSTGIPTTDGGTTARWQQFVTSWTSVLKPNVVSEARFSYHREQNAFPGVDTPDELVKCCGFAKSIEDPLGLGFISFAGTGLTAIGPLTRKPQGRTINVYQFDEAMSVTRGDHLIKFGGTLQLQQVDDVFPEGLRSATTFVGFGPPFDNSAFGLTTGKVFSETQTFALTKLGFERAARRKQFALFAQDTWQVRSNLTLNLGLRYEFVTRPYAKNGGLNNLFAADANGSPIPDIPIMDFANTVFRPVGDCDGCLDLTKRNGRNFAPRLGVAWKATQNTVVRAGLGLQYGEMIFNLLSFDRQNPGFTKGILLPPGSPFKIDLSNAPASLPPAFVYDPNLDRPYTIDWNLSVERALGSATVVKAAYVGNRGKKLLRPFLPNFGTGFRGSRPNPNLGQIIQWRSAAPSWYDSLQVEFRRRFSKGLGFQLSYTYSKSQDEASGEIFAFSNLNFPTNESNPTIDKGRSDFDLTHVFSGNFVYELPVGRGKVFLSNMRGLAQAILGSWEVSGIVTLNTGQPLTFFAGKDVNGDGVVNDRASLLTSLNVLFQTDGLPKNQFFNRAAVGRELTSTGGTTLGRNTHAGPSFKNFDFSAAKRFRLANRGDQGISFEFRASFFNIFNHPNLGQPITDVSSPAFGRITRTTNPGREVEFSTRITF